MALISVGYHRMPRMPHPELLLIVLGVFLLRIDGQRFHFEIPRCVPNQISYKVSAGLKHLFLDWFYHAHLRTQKWRPSMFSSSC